MPGVVLEACSFGLPILARETEPVREVSQYYPRIHFMQDTDAPQEAISAALSLPAADQAVFTGRFSIEAMAERTKSLYDSLLQAKGMRK